jgi:tRNA A-37 threonylcarbamoyl transferase component Bud32
MNLFPTRKVVTFPVRVRGVGWHVAEDMREVLTPELLDLNTHIRTGVARVIKHGPHRTVYFLRLGGLNVYWKHCRISGTRSWLRQCLRPPKARMEFDRALALASRGISTVEPLAWGTRAGALGGESFLITRELTAAVSLQNKLIAEFGCADPAKGKDRRALARSIGEFIARVHDAGVSHPDLHPGNILVSQLPNGSLQYHLLDLHDISLGWPLSWVQSRENLAVFNRWFAMRASRSDRLRFWHGYLSVRTRFLAIPHESAAEVESRTHLTSFPFWAGRARRCLGTNRYFVKVRSPSVYGHAVREMDAAELGRLLADPDSPFRDPGVRLLKDSRTSTVAEITVSTPQGPRTMIYKRFRVKKRLTPLLNLLRDSPALRSWRAGHSMLDRGMPTPRPWLVLHRRTRFGPGEGYLLCEKADGAHVPEALTAFGADRERKWEFIATLARLIRRFNEVRLSHRDLKVANLLWSEAGSGPFSDSFHFIDLVGVARHRRDVSNATRARDLARLAISSLQSTPITRTDRLRFLRAYLNWGMRGKVGWKEWWRRVAVASRAKIEKNRRSGRPLT